MTDKKHRKVMGVSMHYVKIVGGGVVVAGLVVAVIVLAVEVARLSKENNSKGEQPWDKDFRLPQQLQADNYEIFIHPDLEKDTFTGKLTLTFDLTDTLDYMPLHQKGLNVSNPSIEQVGAPGRRPREIDIADSFNAPLNDFFVIKPNSALVAGKYKVSVDFSGSLSQPELVGIYSSNYKVPTGAEFITKKLVTSKFEPTYARRAFPCLDEPEKKATFTISLVKPKSISPIVWTALSNMNEVETVDGPGENEETTKFSNSVKMSTYLACFIVSEFRSKDSTVTNLDGTTFPLRTFAPPHMLNKAQFANDAANSITDYYIKYFNIDYPLPKLDLIAIPDFVSGAMEHWGLITFRETNMLVDSDVTKSSVANQQQVGAVIAHELAHMWFGNLVTMKWWDDLWLNEGFASYIEYKGLNHFRPEWRLPDQFLVSDLQPVMALDAQLSSHPVIQPVGHPDQINELFDTITYSKGSSVIRMLEGILGEQVFKDGVTNYLNEFAFANAQTIDLWNALTAAAEAAGLSVDVTRVMNTWTIQMGLPVVSVEYDEATGKAVLRQKRFFASQGSEGKSQKESPYAYRWDIPLTYTTNKMPKSMTQWFKMEDATVEINFIADATNWIKFNLNQIGFYRVNYDSAMWAKLAQASSNKEFPGNDRSSLLDDVFSLADGGYVEYEQALDFAQYLVNEDDYIAWSTASSKLLKLLPLLSSRDAYVDFKTFVETLVKKQYETSTWIEDDSDGHIDKRLRSTILNLACSCEYDKCLAGAVQPFLNWIADPTNEDLQPPHNTRTLIYNFGIERRGHEKEYWNTMWDLYKNEQDPQEKNKLMVALTFVRDASKLSNYLSLAEDEANVRGQDYFTVLQTISDNDIGQPIVWDYVRNNWEALVERFTLNSRSLGRLIPRITQNFDTPTRLNEMRAFFAKYPEAGAGETARKQALERVEANIQWVDLYYAKIESWLKTKDFPKV